MGMKCPEGHDCGVKSTRYKGVCTPLFCCQTGPKFRPKNTLEELNGNPPKLSKEDMVPASEINDKESEEQDIQKYRRQLAKLKKRHEARMAQIGFVDRGLEGADAEEWVQRRLVALTPRAMAEQEQRLLHGNDQARSDAAKFILESTGHGKKDGPSVGSSPVLILTGIEVPWAKKVVEKAQQVVDAEVITSSQGAPAQRGASESSPSSTLDEEGEA